jgi:thiol-disulfide isomerase/thioredoxin
MKKVVMGLALAAVGGYVAWTHLQPPPERLAAALETAKKEQKLVLLDFTGSDWCGWCIKLEEEALGKPEFIDYAAKYLVTVVVDFPMRRELPADLKAANQALKSRFDVSGFPTLVALSPDGKVVWKQVGFIGGGPFGVIAPLNRSRMALGLPEPAGSAASTLAATPAKPAPAKLPGSASPPTAAAHSSVAHGLPANAPKLQGVFYSRSNPSIILGGKQCGEGDSVEGMRVVKILRNSVLVEWQGRTEELSMH